MSATAGQAQDQRGQAERLGIKPGQVVQEIGYDDDCDEDLRDAIGDVDGVELVGEEYDDVVDVVLLWWRDGDGDVFRYHIRTSVGFAEGEAGARGVEGSEGERLFKKEGPGWEASHEVRHCE